MAGGAAQPMGLRGAIVSGGLACAGAVALLSVALPRFTGYDDRGGRP